MTTSDVSMPEISFSAFKELVQQTLPQAGLITDKNMAAWLKSIATANQPLMWHLNRLKAVGGSEIGSIVAHHMGMPAPFKTTQGVLFRRKLMMDPLEPSNAAMTFGATRETEVRVQFEKRAFTAGWERADTVLEAFARRSADRSVFGGLGFSPDDAFITETGRLCVVDYKTPYRKSPADFIGYSAQLHQGALVAKKELGINPDHPWIKDGVDMLLVYGIHPESKIRERAKSLYLLSYDIEFEPRIEQIIDTHGRSFFADYVMQNRHPSVDPAAVETMSILAAELLELRRQEVAITSKVKAQTEKLTALYLKSESLPDTLSALREVGLVASPSVTEKLTASVEEVRAIAERSDLDPLDFIQTERTPTLDAQRVFAALKEVHPDAKEDDYSTIDTVVKVDEAAILESDFFPSAEVYSKFVVWKIPAASLKVASSPAPGPTSGIAISPEVNPGADSRDEAADSNKASHLP